MKTLYYLLSVLLYLGGLQSLQSQTTKWAWAKSIGNDEDLYASGNLVDPVNGDVYVTGKFRDVVDFDPGPGVFELTAHMFGYAFLMKTDKDGNFLWAKSFGGADANAGGEKLVFDKSGNVIVVGSFSGLVDFDPGLNKYKVHSGGDGSAFIAKLTKDGEFIWAGSFTGGGSNYANDIAVDYSTGDMYLTGSFDHIPTDFDPGPGVLTLGGQGSAPWTIYIVKLDSLGNGIWAKQIGGYSAFTNDEGAALTIDPTQGDLYCTGTFNGDCVIGEGTNARTLHSLGGSDVFFARYHNNGELLWAYSIGSNADDTGTDILFDTTGSDHFFATGTFQNTIYFHPVDDSQLTSAGSSDIFFLWMRTEDEYNNFSFGGPSADSPISILQNPSGDIFLAGNFEGTTNLAHTFEHDLYMSHGKKDFFILKLEDGWKYSWGKTNGGPNDDCITSINLDPDGNIHATGFFRSTKIFFDSADTLIGGQLPVTNDIFMSKLDINSIVGMESPIQKTHWKVFPNPTSDVINLDDFNAYEGPITVDIVDMTGKKVLSAYQSPAMDLHKVNVSALPAGLYSISVTNGISTVTKMFVKI